MLIFLLLGHMSAGSKLASKVLVTPEDTNCPDCMNGYCLNIMILKVIDS